MSIPVELDRLKDETDRYGAVAYLLTAGDDGRPHAVAAVVWDGDRLVATPGSRTRHNASDRPLVSLLWPPAERDGRRIRPAALEARPWRFAIQVAGRVR